MADWKRIKITFPTKKLGDYILPLKKTVNEIDDPHYSKVYGVSNTEGITITGKFSSVDTSKYIGLENNCFAFNPYRINVGSIGINDKNLKGCVSPAYVVFKTKETLDPAFLFHYLKSDYGNHLINWYGNRGGVRNALRFDDLCNIDIPDIDINNQRDILKIIDHNKSSLDKLNEELTSENICLSLLRQSILQEAIEGKLTASWRTQNPVRKGNPAIDAAALLESIRQEKQKLIAEGKIKKEKPLAPISPDEIPFELPDGWVWCRLTEIVNLVTSGSRDWAKYYSTEGDLFIRMGNLSKDSFNLRMDKIQHVRVPKNQEGNRTRLEEGDILVSITGEVGNLGLIPENFGEAYINQHTALIRLNKIIVAKFICYLFLSETLQQQFNAPQRGMKNSYRLSDIDYLLIPLPSPTEQQVIVDRVYKLLAMVNDLEQQVKERKVIAEEMMQAVMREAFGNGAS